MSAGQVKASQQAIQRSLHNMDGLLSLLLQLKKNLLNICSHELDGFLETHIPLFSGILASHTKPQRVDNLENKVRGAVLEILYRLPVSDSLRIYAKHLARLMVDVLRDEENEMNGVMCMKISQDLHKAFYRSVDMKDEVAALIDIIRTIYNNLPDTVKNSFKPVARNSAQLASCMHSLHIVPECPILIIVLFQLYREEVRTVIPSFIPYILNTLQLDVPQEASLRYPAQYQDFVAVLTKTLSFLAVILRDFVDEVNYKADKVPETMIKLLNIFPDWSISHRREILIATRHILATPLNKRLLGSIDMLLDDSLLVGVGHSSLAPLRVLAYNLPIELLQQLRSQLTGSHIYKTAVIYTKTLHDQTLPYSLQTTSAKLLMNLIDILVKSGPETIKDLTPLTTLLRIMTAFVYKFNIIKDLAEKLAAEKSQSGGLILSECAEQAHEASVQEDINTVINELRLLIRTLVYGLKTIVWAFRFFFMSAEQPVAGAVTPGMAVLAPHLAPIFTSPAAQAIKAEYRKLFAVLLENGLKCFVLFKIDPPYPQKDESEVVAQFAGVFAMAEPQVFSAVFASRIGMLVDEIIENEAIMLVPQSLLASPQISPKFFELLLAYLMDNMRMLGSPDRVQSSVILRLFRLTFHSVKLFPENATLFQPSLTAIVHNVFSYSGETREPYNGNYFGMLRSLFRAIGSGKFEGLYKEFLPLLPLLLENLNRLQLSDSSEKLKALFVELSLTVPVRLSALLAHLHLLMKPLVLALQADDNEQLMTQGLRTLELFVDNLVATYLEPIIAPVKEELLTALYKLLRVPSSHSAHALRILGKLGGRSRLFGDLHEIQYFAQDSLGLKIALPLGSGINLDFPVNDIVMASIAALSNASVGALQAKQAFTTLKALHAAVFKQQAIDSQLRVWPVNLGGAYALVRTPPETAGSWWSQDISIADVHAQDMEKLAHAADCRTVKDILRGIYVAAFHDKSTMRNAPQPPTRWSAVGEHEHDVDSTIRPSGDGLLGSLDYAEDVARAWAILAIGGVPDEQSVGDAMRPASTISLVRPSLAPIPTHSASGTSLCERQFPRTLFLDATVDALINKRVSPPFYHSMLTHGLAVFLWEVERIRLASLGIDIAVLYQEQEEIWSHIVVDRQETYKDPDDNLADEVKVQYRNTSVKHEFGYLDGMRSGLRYAYVPLTRPTDPADDNNNPLFADLLDSFLRVASHLCYCRKWRDKLAGLLCLEMLIRFSPVLWLGPRVTVFAKAIMFAMKDTPREISVSTIFVASEILDILLKRLVPAKQHPAWAHDLRGWDKSSTYVSELLDCIIEDLLFYLAIVRKTVQSLLTKLADMTGLTVYQIVEPRLSNVRRIITEANWTRTSITMQLAYLDVFAFCLRIRLPEGVEPLIVSDDKMKGLLMHAAKIAEKDEKELSAQVAQKNKKPLIRLRVACLDLIAASLCSPGMVESGSELKNTLLSVFVKTIALPTPEIVKAAQVGFGDVLASEQHTMPMKMLKQSMSPALAKLGQPHTTLTVTFLEGLARLVKSLKSLFNRQLGEKLLDILDHWRKKEEVENKFGTTSEERGVPVAIISIFHLLPEIAVTLLPRIVETVLAVEQAHAPSQMNSPFRVPLYKFLAVYPEMTIEYFMHPRNLLEHSKASLWQEFLRHDLAADVRHALAFRKMPRESLCDLIKKPLPTSDEDARSLGNVPAEGAPLTSYIINNCLFSLLPEQNKQETVDALVRDPSTVVFAEAELSSPEAPKTPIVPLTHDLLQSQAHVLLFQGLNVIRTLVKFYPEWLGDESRDDVVLVCESLVSYWDSQDRRARLAHEDDPALADWLWESLLLAKCMLPIVYKTKTRYDILARLVTVFVARTQVDYSFLKRALRVELPHAYTMDERRGLLLDMCSMHKRWRTKLSEFAYQVPPDPVPTFPAVDVASVNTEPADVASARRLLELQCVYVEEVISPAIAYCLEKGEGKLLFDDTVLSAIVSELLEPLAREDSVYVVPPYTTPLVFDSVDAERRFMVNGYLYPQLNAFRCDILAFCSMMIKHLPTSFFDTPRKKVGNMAKQMFAFGVTCSKCEQSRAKYAGYLFMARFFESNDKMSGKVIMSLFNDLLEAHQQESRVSVREALDVLVPILPVRVPSSGDAEPEWVTAICTLLESESHQLAPVIHCTSTVVRHSAIFFPYRESFVRHMISALPRIGPPSSNSPEHKKLSVDMCETLIKWEEQRRTQVLALKPSLGSDITGETYTKLEEEVKKTLPSELRHTLSHAEAEALLGFLLKISSIMAIDTVDPTAPNLTEECRKLVGRIVCLWRDVKVSLTYFEKMLQLPPQPPAMSRDPQDKDKFTEQYEVYNKQKKLMLCYVRLSMTMMAELIQTHMQELKATLHILGGPLGNALAYYEPKVLEAYTQIMISLFRTWPLEDVSKLPQIPMSGVAVAPPSTLITDANEQPLQFYIYLCRVFMANMGLDKIAFPMCLSVLERLAGESTASAFVTHLTPVIIAAAKDLIMRMKDHNAGRFAQAASANPAQAQQLQNEKVTFTKLLALIPKIFLGRTHTVSMEYRKDLRAIVLGLLDLGTEVSTSMAALELVREWVFSEDWPAPGLGFTREALDEKVQLVIKCQSMQNLPTEVKSMYLRMAYDVFNKPELCVPTMCHALEPSVFGAMSFMDNQDLRSKFYSLFLSRGGPTFLSKFEYCLDADSWEHVSSTFWIRFAVDLLLSCATNTTLELSARSVRPLPLAGTPMVDATAVTIDQTLIRPDEVVQRLELDSHARIPILIECLRDLCQFNENLAFNIWARFFPLVWSTLNTARRKEYSHKISLLLSKDSHTFYRSSSPHSIKALMVGISRCDPPLSLSPKVVKYVAKNFNSWFGAIHVLETQLAELKRHQLVDPSVPPSPNDPLQICYDALAEVYELLNERDLLLGLWRMRSRIDATRLALVFEQSGQWLHAHEVYVQLMDKHSSYTREQIGLWEANLWESRCVECLRHIYQWDTVSQYANKCHDRDLMLESAWKASQWKSFGEILNSGSPNELDESPEIILYHLYLGITEKKLKDADSWFARGEGLLLKQWGALPPVHTVRYAHANLLRLFQKFVEARESFTIFSTLGRKNAPPSETVKGIFSTWRERLPDESDDTVVWHDILTWRHSMFNLINAVSQDSTNPLAHMGYHEMAWTINTLARVCLKHRLVEVCLNSLGRIYQLPNIEIQDAFTKLREQAKCYFQIPPYHKMGLDIVNSTNLDFFQPNQKAEFFRLKGEFLFKLGLSHDADAAFRSSVLVCDSHGKTWGSWGNFCDKQAQLTENVTQYEKMVTWQSHAMAAYCQAIKSQGGPVHWLSRVFTLLSQASEYEWKMLAETFVYPRGPAGEPMQGPTAITPQVLTQSVLASNTVQCTLPIIAVFGRHARYLPAWVWLPWLPQVFAALIRGPYSVMHVLQDVLLKVGKVYPQALFFSLRTYVYHLKKLQPPVKPTMRKEDETEEQPNPQVSKAVPLHFGELILGSMNAENASLYQGMETLARELCSQSLFPEPECQLLASVHAALQMFHASPPATFMELHEMMYPLFSQIQTALFRTPRSVSEKPGDVRGAHLLRLKNMLGEAFNRDYGALTERLVPGDPRENEPAGVYVERLLWWKLRLQLAARALPRTIPLEKSSLVLLDFMYHRLEIPGQYLAFGEPKPDQNIKVEKLLSDVELVPLHGGTLYESVVSFRGRNGLDYRFRIHMQARMETTLSDERMCYLLRHMNRFLPRHKDTRQRHTLIAIPTMVPIAPFTVLIKEDDGMVSLESVLAAQCWSRGILPDTLILEHSQCSTENDRLIHLQHVISDVVPQNTLQTFVMKSLANSLGPFFAFRSSFASHLAVQSVLTHMFRVQDRLPYHFRLYLRSGQLMTSSFHMGYDDNFLMDGSRDPVPFRLTLNMTSVLGQTGLEGTYVGAALSVARCWSEKRTKLMHILDSFIRDDLSLWYGLSSSKPIPYTGQVALDPSIPIDDNIRLPPAPPGVTNVSAPVLLVMKAQQSLWRAGMWSEVLRGQLLDSVVNENTRLVQEKLDKLAPIPVGDRYATHLSADEATPNLLHFSELVSSAVDFKKWALMPSLWHPWF